MSKREKMIGVIAAGAVAAGIGFSFVVDPWLCRYSRLKSTRSQAAARLKEYQGLLNRASIIKQRFAETHRDSKPHGLAELETIAADSGVTLMDIRPQGRSLDSDSFEERLLSVRSEGTLREQLSFIYAIEQSIGLLQIKRMHLAAQQNSEIIESAFTISYLTPVDPAQSTKDLAAAGSLAQYPESALKKPQSAQKPLEYYLRQMNKRRLIRRLLPEPKRQTASSESASEFIANIRLLGVISGNDAQAIIQDKRSQQTHYLRKGDHIGAAVAEEIKGGCITLSVAGERFELSL